MNKIKKNELSDISEYKDRLSWDSGNSWCKFYNAKFKNKDVIIKVQKKGSLEKTNPKDDRLKKLAISSV